MGRAVASCLTRQGCYAFRVNRDANLAGRHVPMHGVRRRCDLPSEAVLQVGDSYRVEAASGVVCWDVLWIGPLDRLFTRLRMEQQAGAQRRFVLVHHDVSSLRPEGLASRANRFARLRGFRIYGEVVLRTGELGDLLAAMGRAHVAVLGVEPAEVWSLVYDVRFEPDQLARCVRIVENVAVGAGRPYR